MIAGVIGFLFLLGAAILGNQLRRDPRSSVARSGQPTGTPSVSPAPPLQRLQVGPGGCDGLDTVVAANLPDRMQAAQAGDPSSKVGRLGEYVLLESPYEGLDPNFDGRLAPSDLSHLRTSQGQVETSEIEKRGFKEGYERSFASPDGWRGKGFVQAQVFEFASANDAVQFDNESLRLRCQSTKETFTVPAVRGAIGLSLRGSAPPIEDLVSFVRGPRIYVVIRGLGQSPQTHADAAELAFSADEIAR